MAKKRTTRKASPVEFAITKTSNGFLCTNRLSNRHTSQSVHETIESLMVALKKTLPGLKVEVNHNRYYD